MTWYGFCWLAYVMTLGDHVHTQCNAIWRVQYQPAEMHGFCMICTNNRLYLHLFDLWSVYADAWRPALAGYSPASAVQACCDSPSLSSALGSRLPRRILRASLWSSRSPHLRSARRYQLLVPRVRRGTFGTRAFSVAGPTVWNSLPDCLKDPAVDSEQFRRDLKTSLFAEHSRL